MTRYTLINCDFLTASTFLKLSNKAKLLYYAMITNADSLGIVGTCDTIIDTLVKCDDKYEQAKLMGLQDQLKDEYVSAKIELTTKCYLYLFNDKLGNEIFVIKHYFIHNKYRPNLDTNYKKIFRQLEIIDGEYHLKTYAREKTLKERESKGKANESNTNKEINKENEETDLSLDNDNNEEKPKTKMSDAEWDKLMNEISDLNSLDTTLDEDEEEDNDY